MDSVDWLTDTSVSLPSVMLLTILPNATGPPVSDSRVHDAHDVS